eukprot:358700-Chlamydomonas_euryale.AAC.1
MLGCAALCNAAAAVTAAAASAAVTVALHAGVRVRLVAAGGPGPRRGAPGIHLTFSERRRSFRACGLQAACVNAAP